MTVSEKKKTIIFDLVGVVINIDLQRDDEALNAVGLPAFRGCMHHPELRPILLGYLNGLVSAEDFCPALRPFCRAGVTDEEILQAMDEHLADIPASRLAMIASLKDDYNVCLLTNIYERAWKIVVERMRAAGYTPDDCFHRVFLSYEMQMAKPDHAIYETVLHSFGSAPEDAVFIDDTKANVIGAQEVGIKSFCIEMNTLDDAAMRAMLAD